jgi:hypothetical protein
VRSFMRLLLVLAFSGTIPGVFAQDTTTRSGFAIVTLISGNSAGLIAAQTLVNRTSSGVEQATLGPSVLITTASFLVRVGPEIENTTAIAIANPSLGSGGVNLILTNEGGAVVLNATVQLGPHGHFANFLNELFAEPPSEFPTPLLLTVSSEIPIAITGLNFRALDFASIPMTSLSSTFPVPVQPFPPPATSVVTQVGTLPPTAPATTSIGGSGALVFAQIATGGSWSTDIAIGNTSAGIQNIRIDFFGPDGAPSGSLTNIVIPSRGVFFFTTNPEAQQLNQ